MPRAWVLSLLPLLVSCQSMSQRARTAPLAVDEALDYDGTADSMDSLPDCIPELAGSTFWVRDLKGAYECSTTGEWKNRQAAAPDDQVDDADMWSPRPVEK